MNPWLFLLIFLAMFGLGGLLYDLVHRGRQIKQGLGNLVTGLRRVGGEMNALADRCDPPPEPKIMPRIMPAGGVELAAAVVGLVPESAAPRPGPNGHRPKGRGKKGRRRR